MIWGSQIQNHVWVIHNNILYSLEVLISSSSSVSSWHPYKIDISYFSILSPTEKALCGSHTQRLTANCSASTKFCRVNGVSQLNFLKSYKNELGQRKEKNLKRFLTKEKRSSRKVGITRDWTNCVFFLNLRVDQTHMKLSPVCATYSISHEGVTAKKVEIYIL